MRPTDDQLVRYKRGTLPAGEVATVEAWMDTTADAAALLAELDAPESLAVALAGTPKQVDSSTLMGATADATRPAADPDAPVPPLPGGYRFVKELGRGGMGVVLHAEDTTLGRPVAVKMMLPAFAARGDAKERFLREARSLAAVESDYIVPIYHVGETPDGTPYLVMPLLAGETLDARLARGPLPPADLERVARHAAEGLNTAHAKGLIHRDIKPSNIWLEADESGRFRRARLLDFGLARPTQSEVVMTATGQLLGTPAYMSTEQANGDPLTPATDLFSLGATLYHAAAGRRPFEGNTPMGMVKSLALDTPAPVQRLAPALSEPVARLIDDLLAKDPARRPTATEVADRLDAPAAPVRRRPTFGPLVALAAAVLFVFVAVAAYLIVFSNKDGTLAVEVDDDADVRFKKGKLEVYDERGALKYTLEPSEKNKTLAPGKYLVRVVGADGVSLDTDTFEMAKDGKVRVRVTAKKPDEPKKPEPPIPGGPSPFDKLDAKAIPPEEMPDFVPEGLQVVLGSRQCRQWISRLSGFAALRPDGTQFIFLDEGGQGSLFDVKTGRRTRSAVRMSQTSLVYSADGNRLIFGNVVDGKSGLQVTDVTGNEPKPTFFLPAEFAGGPGISQLQRSADGRTVSNCGTGYPETAVILDWPEADKLAVRCTISRKVGFSSRISADGKTLAIRSTQSSTLEVWDVAGKEPKKRLELPGDEGKLEVNLQHGAFDFLPDGRLVAVHADKKLRVWDVRGEKATATVVESWKELPNSVGWNVRVAPSGGTVAVYDEGVIHSMTVPKTGAAFGAVKRVETQILKLDGQNIGSLEFSADGKRALTTHIGGYFVVWDVTADGFVVHSGPKQSAFVELGISPDGKTLIGGSQQQATRYEFGEAAPKPMKPVVVLSGLWPDLRLAWGGSGYFRPLSTDNSKPFNLPEEYGWSQLDYRSSSVLNGVPIPGQPGQLRWRCWDLSTDNPTKIAELKQSVEVPVFLFAGGKQVISRGGYDEAKKVHKYTLWTNDGGTYKPTDTFEMGGEADPGMASSPDGKRVATLRGQVYDVADGKIKLLKTLGGSNAPRIYRPVFSPDGKKIAFPGRVTVWDIESETLEYQWPEELSATKVLFAPDGRHLITANANGTAFVIRLPVAK